MKSIKMMLLGIGFILIGIFCRVSGIGYVYSRFFVHYLPIASVVIGAAFLAIGFFGSGE